MGGYPNQLILSLRIREIERDLEIPLVFPLKIKGEILGLTFAKDGDIRFQRKPE